MAACCAGDVNMLDVCERETLTSTNKHDGVWDSKCWDKTSMPPQPRAHKVSAAQHYREFNLERAQEAATTHCAALASFSAEHQKRLDALCEAVSRLQVAVESLRGARCVRCGMGTGL